MIWQDVKGRKAGVAIRITEDGAYSIINHAVSEGGKWELFRETGQRKLLGEFDTLAEAKARVQARAEATAAAP